MSFIEGDASDANMEMKRLPLPPRPAGPVCSVGFYRLISGRRRRKKYRQ